MQIVLCFSNQVIQSIQLALLCMDFLKCIAAAEAKAADQILISAGREKALRPFNGVFAAPRIRHTLSHAHPVIHLLHLPRS